MPSNLTTAGAAAALAAVSGSYFVGLGTGQSPSGLVGEAASGGYARQPATLVPTGTTATNGAAVTFAGFTTTLGSFTHAGLFTAATGGTCLWVGSLTAAVNITAGGSITFQAGDLDTAIATAA
ncbi:hypothetical protein [Elioraea sp.]|uniref:phage tail fiber protein n=1 Tax=Elioraea sp. TaxID=2185103 RepID=UPI0025C457C9|nr:hypothetical protein [Elioraea sp.]